MRTSVVSGKTHSTVTSLTTGAMAFFRDLIICKHKPRKKTADVGFKPLVSHVPRVSRQAHCDVLKCGEKMQEEFGRSPGGHSHSIHSEMSTVQFAIAFRFLTLPFFPSLALLVWMCALTKHVDQTFLTQSLALPFPESFAAPFSAATQDQFSKARARELFIN